MKNFVFISPNFPTNYWQFCAQLKSNGLRVLGIGDCPYDELLPELRGALDDYFRVSSLENYDEVFRAVAFLTYRYGKIDWLESNNEYWLERDALLRTEFHITTGFQSSDMDRIKLKSAMKAYYKKAGIPAARYHIAKDLKGSKAFIAKVGYPVIVKPDNGVGANNTYKLKNEQDLERFFATKDDNLYIMEEFMKAEVHSYDAIIDSKGQPIFETGNVTPMSIMDIVNNNDNSIYYIEKNLPDEVREAGRKTVAAFGVTSRFVHLEFFRLTEDMESIGPAGTIAGLEVNMRPSGGFSADMFNFANSTDVYKIWADMVAFDHNTLADSDLPHYYCAYCGRRDGKDFLMNTKDIIETYGDHLCMVERIPDALAGAMANMMYVANFDTKEEMEEFYQALLATHEE